MLMNAVPPPGRLLDQLRGPIRCLHHSIRTQEAGVHWVRAFVRFHGLRHPADLGGADVEAFLARLATDRNVAVSIQQQALSALLFVYQKVLGLSVPWMNEISRPQRAPGQSARCAPRAREPAAAYAVARGLSSGPPPCCPATPSCTAAAASAF
jgi:hypothetical protein